MILKFNGSNVFSKYTLDYLIKIPKFQLNRHEIVKRKLVHGKLERVWKSGNSFFEIRERRSIYQMDIISVHNEIN